MIESNPATNSNAEMNEAVVEYYKSLVKELMQCWLDRCKPDFNDQEAMSPLVDLIIDPNSSTTDQDLQTLQAMLQNQQLYLLIRTTLVKELAESFPDITTKFDNRFSSLEILVWGYRCEQVGLRSLDLSGNALCRLDATGWQAFCAALQSLPQLQSLDLRMNALYRLDATGWQALGVALQSLPQLQSLDLSLNLFNHLSTSGWQALGAALQPLTQLQSLGLNGNALFQLEVSEWQALGAALQPLTQLRLLVLSNNDFHHIFEASRWQAFCNVIRRSTVIQLMVGLEHLPAERAKELRDILTQNIRQRCVKPSEEEGQGKGTLLMAFSLWKNNQLKPAVTAEGKKTFVMAGNDTNPQELPEAVVETIEEAHELGLRLLS